MMVQPIIGAQASRLLSDSDFARDWRALAQRCPWATAFQGPDYALAWYSSYEGTVAPLLIVGRDGTGGLVGLLALGIWANSGQVVVVGGRQAEYHAWICEPELSSQFPAQAIACLQSEVPHAGLTFRYLPPNTPVAWIDEPPVSNLCKVQAFERPMLRIGDGAAVVDLLAKKKNKARFQQLNKLGPVSFGRVADPAEFQGDMAMVIEQYDSRQGALHGAMPFRDDKRKQAFYLKLMDSPDLLHVSVLRIGGQVAAAHLGVCGGGQLHLGIMAHDPDLAKYSPGRCHMLFLADLLRQEGFACLDLTPGDDAYKEHFANACDQVYMLTVFSSAGRRRIAEFNERVRRVGKTVLRTLPFIGSKFGGKA